MIKQYTMAAQEIEEKEDILQEADGENATPGPEEMEQIVRIEGEKYITVYHIEE